MVSPCGCSHAKWQTDICNMLVCYVVLSDWSRRTAWADVVLRKRNNGGEKRLLQNAAQGKYVVVASPGRYESHASVCQREV